MNSNWPCESYKEGGVKSRSFKDEGHPEVGLEVRWRSFKVKGHRKVKSWNCPKSWPKVIPGHFMVMVINQKTLPYLDQTWTTN